MKKKWAVKRITINLAVAENEKLEQYCAITGRAASDVIRELIRSLDKSAITLTSDSKTSHEWDLSHDFVRLASHQKGF